MSARERLAAVADGVAQVGADAVELYLKSGRSRRFEVGSAGRVATFVAESGWAVRASSARASLHACGSGTPDPQGPWPEPDGHPLALPAPRSVPAWRSPPDLDAPLLVESEAVALVEGVDRLLRSELPRARLFRAVVEDGASQASLASTLGVEAETASRAASLLLEAGIPGGRRPVRWLMAARRAAEFEPRALARRLVDRIVVREEGVAAPRDRGEVLLAPPVAAAALEGLLPALVGARAVRLARQLRDRRGRLGAPALTVVDDGRLPGGVFSAAVDGEGMPTRAVVLVERGVFRQPLVAWSDGAEPVAASGCARRPSWRDLPRPGPTHLYLAPDPAVAPATLVESVARGAYLLDVLGRGTFDLAGDRFALPVCGFLLRRGRAAEPLASGWLHGGVRALLHGLQGVARDLQFRPAAGGLIGAPTLKVSGLELSERSR